MLKDWDKHQQMTLYHGTTYIKYRKVYKCRDLLILNFRISEETVQRSVRLRAHPRIAHFQMEEDFRRRRFRLRCHLPHDHGSSLAHFGLRQSHFRAQLDEQNFHRHHQQKENLHTFDN